MYYLHQTRCSCFFQVFLSINVTNKFQIKRTPNTFNNLMELLFRIITQSQKLDDYQNANLR